MIKILWAFQGDRVCQGIGRVSGKQNGTQRSHNCRVSMLLEPEQHNLTFSETLYLLANLLLLKALLLRIHNV